jgi:selT/selW/selH-like putative selenoprotein
LALDAITLIQGDRGIFEVHADGALIFSKKVVGRFPTHAEIITAIREKKSDSHT